MARHVFRFSMGSCLVMLALFSVALAFLAEVKQRRADVEKTYQRLEELGVHIFYAQPSDNELMRLLGLSCRQSSGIRFASAPASPEVIDLVNKLPKLEHIDLSYSDVSERDLQRLAPRTECKSFDCSQCDLSHIEVVYHLFPNLEQLRLSGTSIDDEQLEQLDSLTRLKTLELRQCYDLSSACLESIGDVPSLEEVYISNVTTVLSPFMELAKCKRLRGLEYSYSELEPRLMTGIGQLNNLVSLDISGASLDSAAVEAVSSLRGLEHLKLDDCRIAGVGPIANLQRLKSLSLANTETDGQLMEIMPSMSNLEELNLTGFSLELTEQNGMLLRRLRRLSVLTARYAQCTPEFIGTLVGHDSVGIIDLRHSRVHWPTEIRWDFGANLQLLDLSDTNVPASLIKQIESASGSAKVVFDEHDFLD